MITSSSSFVLESVAEFYNGMATKSMEEATNGPPYVSGIMKEVINTFEKWPRDVTMVEKEATVKIREWWEEEQTRNHRLIPLEARLLLQLMLRPENLIVKVQGPGRIKAVFIQFVSGILLMFEIKKKQKMSPLRTLAAEKISDCISKREDIKQLEVPNAVMDDLNDAFDDCWRVKHNTADS